MKYCIHTKKAHRSLSWYLCNYHPAQQTEGTLSASKKSPASFHQLLPLLSKAPTPGCNTIGQFYSHWGHNWVELYFIYSSRSVATWHYIWKLFMYMYNRSSFILLLYSISILQYIYSFCCPFNGHLGWLQFETIMNSSFLTYKCRRGSHWWLLSIGTVRHALGMTWGLWPSRDSLKGSYFPHWFVNSWNAFDQDKDFQRNFSERRPLERKTSKSKKNVRRNHWGGPMVPGQKWNFKRDGAGWGESLEADAEWSW